MRRQCLKQRRAPFIPDWIEAHVKKHDLGELGKELRDGQRGLWTEAIPRKVNVAQSGRISSNDFQKLGHRVASDSQLESQVFELVVVGKNPDRFLTFRVPEGASIDPHHVGALGLVHELPHRIMDQLSFRLQCLCTRLHLGDHFIRLLPRPNPALHSALYKREQEIFKYP